MKRNTHALLLFSLLFACGDAALPSGNRAYDALSYELVASFDWSTRTLTGHETITLALAAGASPIVSFDTTVAVKAVYAGATPLSFTASSADGTLTVDLTPIARGAGPVSFSVDYEATPSDALIAAGPRDDDPVPVRVVYTDSEPDRGVSWRVAKEDPSDRATWAVELTVASDEDVIANGTRTKDQLGSRGRVVRYEMAQPIPSYLMAFAAGHLDHAERTTGRVPLAVWYRHGLLLDPERTLDILADVMATYERLLGPYPWDRYAVVYLPQYGGGMENATITFNTEIGGQGTVAFNLNAHEFGHQWFGDWVTVATFDDLWIKEGMATLLAAEADRARRDAEGRGRLFGSDFAFNARDRIRDRSLPPRVKYTSGPYTRAAWLLTQIRRRVGEDAFWASLRGVLQSHALGSIDSETFVRGFAPALDPAGVSQVLRILDATDRPVISIGGTPPAVSLALSDSSRTLVAPMEVTVVDMAGAATTTALTPGVDTPLTVPEGGYLALDENDVHPSWPDLFAGSSSYFATLAPLFMPPEGAAREAFSSRSAAHQERALAALGALPLAPEAFAAFYASLDSTTAQRLAAVTGCGALVGAADPQAWSEALGPVLLAPATTNYSTRFAACGATFPAQLLEAELRALAAAPTPTSAPRLGYLMSFDYGTATSLEVLGGLATSAPSLALRDLAVSRLGSQATPGRGYTEVPSTEKDAWKAFFRARLDGATSRTRFLSVWRGGVVGLIDDGALVAAAHKLHTIPLFDDEQREVVCNAYSIAQQVRPAAWIEFQQAAQPFGELSGRAQEVLNVPQSCP